MALQCYMLKLKYCSELRVTPEFCTQATKRSLFAGSCAQIIHTITVERGCGSE